MTYKAKLPDDSVNVSETNMGLYGLRVIFGFIGFMLVSFIAIAMLSDYVVRFIPVETENRLYSHLDFSSHFAEELADEKYQIRAKQLLNKVPPSIRPEGYELNIFVIEEQDANAFALPGGLILLTTGLMNELDRESALMFVIGHEIGHFHGRDHLEGISRQILLQLAAGLFLGQSSVNLGRLENILNLTVDTHYSRHAESEADQWGIETLMATYGHVGGAKDFFNKIQDEDANMKWAEMFSTHPVTEKRIMQIDNYIQARNYAEQK